MTHWMIIAAIAAGFLAGVVTVALLLIRRVQQSAELERLLKLARRVLKDRTIPVDVEIDQDLPITLSGSYTLPANLRFTVQMDEPFDIEANVPVRANLPIDAVIESSVLKIGTVKVPIQGQVPVNLDIPVRTQARIRSDALPVRLTEELKLDLPQVVVPLKAKLRVHIPLHLPDTEEEAPLPATPATNR